MTTQESLNRQIVKATKWSGITEIVVRLIAPVSNMVLARILTPEAFGVVTSLILIISFSELFTDAGFQKYIIQHEFRDDNDKILSTNVAFWSNFILSLLIWSIIAFFSESLALMVGSPGCGLALIVTCVLIPLEAFSSIQLALYRRDFDYRCLFRIRFISILIPLFVTIPFALWLRSYWALVIGMISQNLLNAFLLTLYSRWKPAFCYSWSKLKEMLSFTIWSLVESVSIWLTSYVDVFIVGTILSQYYLGLYKTSSTLVGQILGLITAATTPVLFASLSRLQHNDMELKTLFLKFQKYVSILVIPMGFGVYCFSNLITKIALGDQWMEAAGFIGLWGLTSSIMIVLSHYSCEIYRAKGRPKLSVLSQFLHIIFLWPVVMVAVRYGFETLYIARSLIRFEGLIVDMVLLYFLIRLSPWRMIRNIVPALTGSTVMLIFGLLMKSYFYTYIGQIVTLICCSIVYLCVIYQFSREKEIINAYLFKLIRK